MPWNQQMSFPSTIELRTTQNGIKLFRNPIKEIKDLYTKTHVYVNKSINYINKKTKYLSPELIDLSLSFSPLQKDELVINIRGQEIIYKTGSFLFQDTNIPAPLINGEVKIRVLLDRPSVEIFVNDGASVMTTYAISDKNNNKIFFSSKRNLKIDLSINELQSSWKK